MYPVWQLLHMKCTVSKTTSPSNKNWGPVYIFMSRYTLAPLCKNITTNLHYGEHDNYDITYRKPDTWPSSAEVVLWSVGTHRVLKLWAGSWWASKGFGGVFCPREHIVWAAHSWHKKGKCLVYIRCIDHSGQSKTAVYCVRRNCSSTSAIHKEVFLSCLPGLD